MRIENRVFFHVIGTPFYRRLVLPFASLLFVAVQLDSVIDWEVLRDQLTAAPPWHVAILFTALFTLWGVIAGRLLRPVWRQPVIAFLIRQPLSRWQWVGYLMPSLSIAFAPIIGIWWLAPHYAAAPIHYVGFVGLVWTTILGASFHGARAAKWVTAGTVVTALFILGYAYLPIVAFAAAIVSVALLPLCVSGIRYQTTRMSHATDGNLESTSPTIAIVRRDFRYLWRLERKPLFGMIQLAVFVGLIMLALRINGKVVGREAFEFACGLLSLALLPIYDILTRLKSGLGPELVRRRWSLTYQQRAFALLGITLGLAIPSFAVLCLLGHSMGPMYVSHFTLYTVTTLLLISALFSQTLLGAAVSIGWSLWILLIHTMLVIFVSPWAYVLSATFLILVAFQLIVSGLREFAEVSELHIRE